MTTATLPNAPIAGPEYKSPEWYDRRFLAPDDKERPVVFGASLAAGACSVSPYTSPRAIYHEMRREIPPWEPKTFLDGLMLYLGSKFEPIIVEAYAEQQECEVETGLPMFLSAEHSFMGATPDAIAHAKHGQWEVEAKCSNWRMFDSTGEDEHKYGRAGTDEVPTSALFQAQQQMAVLGFKRVDFPVLKNGNQLLVYRVDRSDELIKQIVDAEKELAERIVNGEPPEPDYRHSGTARLLQDMYGCEVGSVAYLTEELGGLWEQYRELGETAKIAKQRQDEIKNRVLAAMGENQIARFPGADFQLKRSVIDDSYWTEEDVKKIVVGEVKRRGHVRLTQSKVK